MRHAAPPLAFVQVVNTSLPCVKCTYNLKGESVWARCPACGEPVVTSLPSPLLQFASPEYIRTVRSGLSLVLNSMLIGIGVGLLAPILMAAFNDWSFFKVTGHWGLLAINVAFGIPLQVASAIGYWRISAKDPGVPDTHRLRVVRSFIRYAVIIEAISAVIRSVLPSDGAGAPPALTVTTLAYFALNVINITSFLVLFVALMTHLKWLGARVPDTFIIRRSSRYRWLLPLLSIGLAGLTVILMLLVLAAAEATAGSGSLEYSVPVMMIGVPLALAGMLTALILYWNVLHRLRKHMRNIEATGQIAGVPSGSN